MRARQCTRVSVRKRKRLAEQRTRLFPFQLLHSLSFRLSPRISVVNAAFDSQIRARPTPCPTLAISNEGSNVYKGCAGNVCSARSKLNGVSAETASKAVILWTARSFVRNLCTVEDFADISLSPSYTAWATRGENEPATAQVL